MLLNWRLREIEEALLKVSLLIIPLFLGSCIDPDPPPSLNKTTKKQTVNKNTQAKKEAKVSPDPVPIKSKPQLLPPIEPPPKKVEPSPSPYGNCPRGGSHVPGKTDRRGRLHCAKCGRYM